MHARPFSEIGLYILTLLSLFVRMSRVTQVILGSNFQTEGYKRVSLRSYNYELCPELTFLGDAEAVFSQQTV